MAEPAEVSEEARRLGASFRMGRRCVPEALARLRALRSTYGVHGYVGKALALAYRGCDDALAWAQLFAELAGPGGPADARLKLGAAWLEAHRPREALAVLRPLALEAGPTSRAAWLTGYALFELDAWDEAAVWLQGARQTVQDVRRSDAPIMLALVGVRSGALDEAERELDAAIEALPTSAPLHATRAYVLAAAGREGDARVAADAAVALARQDESRTRKALRAAMLGEAYGHAQRREADDEADRLFERWLTEVDTDQAQTLLTRRAAMLDATGRTRDAAAARARLRGLSAD